MAAELGLGLISIGRGWGVRPAPLPTDTEAEKLLETALECGIRFFDTAPSYGLSEQRLGAFLRGHGAVDLTIATKCGEHWSDNGPFVDHSFDALRSSIDRSLALLARIDLLQIHKATTGVLARDDLHRALEYARSCGVREFGASVTDLDAARTAARDPAFGWIQIFFHPRSPQLEPVFGLGKRVLVNRPFAMGALAYDDDGQPRGPEDLAAVFAFTLRRRFEGVVLTGTRSPEHLRQNAAAFRRARAMVEGC
ncbi:MAG: aldo/keto reductase [Bryobacteraceae bacterium]